MSVFSLALFTGAVTAFFTGADTGLLPSIILIIDDIFDAFITANSKTYLAKSEYFKSFISFLSI